MTLHHITIICNLCQQHSKNRHSTKLTSNHLRNSLHQTHNHNPNAKNNARHRGYRPPTPCTQLDITQRRQDVRERTRARRADDLEDGAEIARDETDRQRGYHQPCAENEVAGEMVGFVFCVEVVGHHFAADETFQGEGGEHVEAEAQAGDLHDDGAVDGEVVEDVAGCEVAEC